MTNDLYIHTHTHTGQQPDANYYSLDLFKFIFTFFIIALHTTPFADVNFELERFTSILWKIAVPFYFASSGFLFFNKLEIVNNKIKRCQKNILVFKRYFFRLIVLYTVWSIVFVVDKLFTVYHFKIDIHIIKDYIYSYFISATYYHLWYLLCLIYAVFLLYFILQFVTIRTFFYFSVLLYIVGLIPQSYGWLINVEYLNSFATRFDCIFNSLFRAVPLIFTGIYISANRKNVRNSNRLIILLSALLALLIIESYLVISNDWSYSYVLFTLPFCFCFFLLVKNIDLKPKHRDLFKLLRNMSTVIYCVHPLVYDILPLNELHSLVRFIAVSAISLFFAFVVVKISKCKHLSIVSYMY